MHNCNKRRKGQGFLSDLHSKWVGLGGGGDWVLAVCSVSLRILGKQCPFLSEQVFLSLSHALLVVNQHQDGTSQQRASVWAIRTDSRLCGKYSWDPLSDRSLEFLGLGGDMI